VNEPSAFSVKLPCAGPVTSAAVSLILQTLDRIKLIVAELERTAADQILHRAKANLKKQLEVDHEPA